MDVTFIKKTHPDHFTILQSIITINKKQFCLLNKAFTEVEGHTFMYSAHPTLHLYGTRNFNRVTRHTVSSEGCAWWLILLILKVPVVGGVKVCPARTVKQPSWNPKQEQGHQKPCLACPCPVPPHGRTPSCLCSTKLLCVLLSILCVHLSSL